jgi:DNA-binding PadR family transcriptional regulator
VKVYRLTPAGRRRLHDESTDWTAFVRAVARIMNPGAKKATS